MTEGHVKLDTSRRERVGFDEAVLCAGKTLDQLTSILERADESCASLLLTRLSQQQFDGLAKSHRDALDYESLSGTAVLGEVVTTTTEPRIAVVSAGTSDLPIAREAVRTLAYYGQPCLEIYDVGVAGLWRLLERIEELRDMAIVIAVAGMDASLPSVIGGLLPGVIIAVPTSIGYGTAAGGQAALGSVLTSCAPGVAVVNIDNGFGAACLALRIMRSRRDQSL